MLGSIPSGFPTLTFPAVPLADYLRRLPGALATVAILLCVGLLVVRSYANKYGYKADGDQMLFAYGAANVAAAFTGSLVTGNSPSRSAAMDGSGARSQVPSSVAAVTTAIVQRCFTDMLAFLPKAALAGIVATVAVTRADQPFRDWLEKYELMKLVDSDGFYPTNRHAAAAFREATAPAAEE